MDEEKYININNMCYYDKKNYLKNLSIDEIELYKKFNNKNNQNKYRIKNREKINEKLKEIMKKRREKEKEYKIIKFNNYVKAITISTLKNVLKYKTASIKTKTIQLIKKVALKQIINDVYDSIKHLII